jgi:aminopeptidase YwaD
MHKLNRYDISADTLHEYVKKILSFGIRSAGTTAHSRAIDYMHSQFSRLGLTTADETFTSDCFGERRAQLFLEEPETRLIDCYALWFSTNTEPEGTAGQLKYAPSPRALDSGFEGKIALLKRSSPSWTSMRIDYRKEACAASKAGARALVLINSDAFPFRATLESGYHDPDRRLLPIEPRAIPCGSISSHDGEYLLALMQRGRVTARLLLDTWTGRKTLRNTRGILNPKAKGKRVLITAHTDVAGIPGADDNACGMSLLLQVARTLAGFPLRRQVEFVALGQEEVLSSRGSLAYVSAHKHDLKRILCVINVDGAGRGEFQYVTGGRWYDANLTTAHWLNKLLRTCSRALGYRLVEGFCSVGSGDEGRFIEAGVDATMLWTANDPYYHSRLDNLRNINPNSVKAACEIVAECVYRLAS